MRSRTKSAHRLTPERYARDADAMRRAYIATSKRKSRADSSLVGTASRVDVLMVWLRLRLKEAQALFGGGKCDWRVQNGIVRKCCWGIERGDRQGWSVRV